MDTPASNNQGSIPATPRDVITKSLDITNLDDVLHFISKHGLPNAKWESLGLKLGLLKHTLEDIKHDKKEAELCMMGCLGKWLEEQDNVIKKGQPSWCTLVKAIGFIDKTISLDMKKEFMQHSFSSQSSESVQLMTEEKKKELEMKNFKVKQAYASTVFDIFDSFKGREFDIDKIACAVETYLNLLQVKESDHDVAIFASFRAIQSIVLKHTSWFNYALLQFVVEKCGKKEEKDLLERYIQGPFECYRELPIVEVPSESFDCSGSKETHKREIFYRLPSTDSVTTVHNLRSLTDSLQRQLNLFSLCLKRHEAGGTELFFGIPDVQDLQSRLSSFSSHTEWDEQRKVYRITESMFLLSVSQANKYCGENGKYNFCGIIGKGAFGAVYRATKMHINEDVAIKLIALKSMSNVQVTVDNNRGKAKLEAATLFKLKHQHIVKYFDSYDYDVPNHSLGLAIVLEYCPKRDLQLYLSQNQTHPVNMRCKWYLQLANACSYIHSQNIVHRDLKPANILIDNDNNLQVCDVGLAKTAWAAHQSQACNNSISSYTDSSSVSFNQYMTSAAGTKYYMAPEVWSGRYTSKCDIFSLGLVYIKIAESQSIIGTPTAKLKKPLGQVLSKFYKVASPCTIMSCAFKQAENAEIRLCNKMLQYDPSSRPSMSEVEQEVNTMMNNTSMLMNIAEQFNTSVDRIIQLFQHNDFFQALNEFYREIEAMNSCTRNNREILKSININHSLSDYIFYIKPKNKFVSAFCKVSDSLSAMLEVEIPDLLQGVDMRMDKVIEQCEQCLQLPDYDEINAMFDDVKKLKVSLKTIKNDCNKVEEYCTSAAELCQVEAGLKFTKKLVCFSFFIIGLVTFAVFFLLDIKNISSFGQLIIVGAIILSIYIIVFNIFRNWKAGRRSLIFCCSCVGSSLSVLMSVLFLVLYGMLIMLEKNKSDAIEEILLFQSPKAYVILVVIVLIIIVLIIDINRSNYFEMKKHEMYHKKITNSVDNFHSATQSLFQHYQKISENCSKLEQIKVSIDELRPYSDEYGHYTSEIIAKSLFSLKHMCACINQEYLTVSSSLLHSQENETSSSTDSKNFIMSCIISIRNFGPRLHGNITDKIRKHSLRFCSRFLELRDHFRHKKIQ